MSEHDHLGDTAAHCLANSVLEVLLRIRVTLLRKRPGDTEGHASGQDRDLVERVAVREHRRKKRVAAFVERCGLLLFGAEDH